MGNMMVRRPDLFGAVSCAVPLLDMRSYHTLLAGASWMAEYGDPDKPEDWAFLQRYSAYHNIDPAAVRAGRYPPLLMTTSTRDDRVHPYHARCFVKRLLDIGSEGEGTGADRVVYYENLEGGHGGAADSKQQAFMSVRPYLLLHSLLLLLKLYHRSRLFLICVCPSISSSGAVPGIPAPDNLPQVMASLMFNFGHQLFWSVPCIVHAVKLNTIVQRTLYPISHDGRRVLAVRTHH